MRSTCTGNQTSLPAGAHSNNNVGNSFKCDGFVSALINQSLIVLPVLFVYTIFYESQNCFEELSSKNISMYQNGKCENKNKKSFTNIFVDVFFALNR